MTIDHGFVSPPCNHTFEAFLFDMDGTIIDSTDAVVQYWHQIGREIGVDGDDIAKREGEIPVKYGADAIEIPGSRVLLEQLTAKNVPWGIVTSGTKPLVNGWLTRMALPAPDTMITAEEVAKGKPDPSCYLEGAVRLGKQFDKKFSDPSKVLVLEDAPAGIRAGKAAGFKVLGLATTHSIDSLKQAGADWIVRDPRSTSLQNWDAASGLAILDIRDALL